MKIQHLSHLGVLGYESLIAGASSLKSTFLLVVRLYWGWQMFVAGSAHLSDVPAMVERFEEWNVPFPIFSVYLSGVTEMVCGLLLLAGFASRLISIPLIINFSVAYLTASREVVLNLFSDPDAFVSDAAFLFLLSALIIFIFGPGAFSIDACLKKLFRYAAPGQGRAQYRNVANREGPESLVNCVSASAKPEKRNSPGAQGRSTLNRSYLQTRLRTRAIVRPCQRDT